MKIIAAAKASKEFGRFLDTVQREPVMVTKKDRPVGVMLSIQDAEILLAMQTELGIKRGIADIGAERFNEFTPKYALDLAAGFKKRLQNVK
ncbi:MAG: type II toxin-antitoxin system Phd/YefM family antitoxin [Robiginitomaculum sp.]|nr:type II toxin-antitoxin system Phd/YefM family antitoxin [Robiginitomaculum sp.]